MSKLSKLTQLLCIASVATLCATSALAAAEDDRFVEAMRLYHDGRYAASYGRLVELADRGDAEAARIALLMVRYGPQLYGSQWSASGFQIERWLSLATVRPPQLVADGGD